MSNDNPTRRRFLTLTGTATAAALAGCTNTNNTEEPNTDTADTDDTTNTPAETDQSEHPPTLDDPEVIEIAKQTRAATVSLHLSNGGGTGWTYNTAEGLIVTNSHVARGSETAEVRDFNGNTYTANVIDYTEDHIPDVALLQIQEADRDAFDLPELTIGNDQELSQDDRLLHVGHPYQIGEFVASTGKYTGHQSAVGWFTSTLASQSGNSGSATVNMNGEVVGITSGSTTDRDSEYPRKHDEDDPIVYEEFPDDTDATTHAPITEAMEYIRDWE